MMRRFYIEPQKSDFIKGQEYIIKGPDSHHIRDVLRLHPGKMIELFDGSGFIFKARIISLDKSGVKVAFGQRYATHDESHLQIRLAQALIKGPRMDCLLRQITELGIYQWTPFQAQRSIPEPGPGQTQRRVQRWNKIAVEAAKQSHRSTIPKINAPMSFKDILAQAPEYDLKFIFQTGEHVQPLTMNLSGGRIILLIGPEGGFTRSEIILATTCGFIEVSLGPHILRSETAAIAACTLIQYIFGDLC